MVRRENGAVLTAEAELCRSQTKISAVAFLRYYPGSWSLHAYRVYPIMVLLRSLALATVSVVGAIGALYVRNEGWRAGSELTAVAEERRVRRTNNVARRRRRTAAKWLHKHGQPRACEHPFVWRLFAEMGDHPLDRDYYTIAHRRLARWFSELPTIDETLGKIATTILPPRPAEDVGPALDEWLTNHKACKDKLALELKADTMAFQQRYGDMGAIIVRPPPEVTYRYSCQIIEGAIQMRVEDLEESQNILRSEEVRTAGIDQLSWFQQFTLWRRGVVGITEIASKPPAIPSGTP